MKMRIWQTATTELFLVLVYYCHVDQDNEKFVFCAIQENHTIGVHQVE